MILRILIIENYKKALSECEGFFSSIDFISVYFMSIKRCEVGWKNND